MTKRLRGSYYVDGRRSMTLTTTGDDKLVDVGFRLVYETGMSPVRGMIWSSDMALQVAASYLRDAQLESAGVGFRLCSNGGGT